MGRPKTGPKSQKKQLVIGIGALVLALCMGIPQLTGGSDDGVIEDVHEPWLSEADAVEPAADLGLEDDDLAAAADDVETEAPAVARRRIVADLLASHGSYAGTSVLPNRFWQPAPPPAPEPAKPEVQEPQTAPETDTEAVVEAEEEEEPLPQHRVTIVYLTDDVLRAVMDGRVVGVGDSVDAGVVKAIRMDGVLVSTTRGTVLYALGAADAVLPGSGDEGGPPWPGKRTDEESADD